VGSARRRRGPLASRASNGIAAPLGGSWCTSGTLTDVANLQKRGSYTPRRAREQRAFRLIVAGSAAGAVGVVSLVLAIAGVIGATLPIIALIVAALCWFGFSRSVAGR
jgi:hypothetical protein